MRYYWYIYYLNRIYIYIYYRYLHIYTLWHYLTLHYITPHSIKFHHVTSHYITLHYITSPHITLHHITSHHITLHTYHTYHTIPYHTIPYHAIPCHTAMHILKYISMQIWICIYVYVYSRVIYSNIMLRQPYPQKFARSRCDACISMPWSNSPPRGEQQINGFSLKRLDHYHFWRRQAGDDDN